MVIVMFGQHERTRDESFTQMYSVKTVKCRSQHSQWGHIYLYRPKCCRIEKYPKSQKAINADTRHLIFVKHWFRKQDIPKIIISFHKTSIEPYALKLAFEYDELRKSRIFMSISWHKTFNN